MGEDETNEIAFYRRVLLYYFENFVIVKVEWSINL